jgi:hypothetical protein
MSLDERIYDVRLQKVINEIQDGLRDSAADYFEVGIELYKKLVLEKDALIRTENFQVIFGNLCISIELMLKSAIAKEAFIFLYKQPPDDIAMPLIYPSKVKGRLFVTELVSFKNLKSIEFNEAVGRFYKLYPETKPLYKSYLDSFSDLRNSSVHAYVPRYNAHELERVVYASVVINKFLCDKKILHKNATAIDSFADDFVSQYQTEQMASFDKKIKAARAKANSNSMDPHKITISETDWNRYITTCPICKSDAILEGETENSQEWDVEDDMRGNYRGYPGNALVVSFNSGLFIELINRWATEWRKMMPISSKEEDILFKKIWQIFYSKVDALNGLITNKKTLVKCKNIIKREYGI